MKSRLLILSAALLLSSCFNSKESMGRYNLPVRDIKSPTKEGRACNKYIFPFYGFYSDSDLSVEKARKEAGITSITAIEQSSGIFAPIIPLYVEKCVIVKGN